MQNQNQKVSFQEWYQTLRNQIIISYDNAKEIALKNYDTMGQKLNEQLQINEALKATKEPNLLDKSADTKQPEKKNK